MFITAHRCIEWLKLAENKITVVFWGLLLLVVSMPLFLGGNRPMPWSFMAFFVGMLLLLWGCALSQKKEISRVSLKHVWFIALPFLFVMLWIAIQAFFLNGTILAHPVWLMANNILPLDMSSSITLDISKTQESFMKFLSYGAIFWLSLQLGRSKSNAKRMLAAISIIGGLYALYGLMMHFLEIEKVLWYDKKMYTGSVSSTFINRNSYATYVGIGIIASVALLFSSLFENIRQSNKRYFYRTILNNLTTKGLLYLLITILLIATLIMTNSRAGIVSVSVGFISFISLLVLTRPTRGYRRIILAFMTFLILAFTFALSVGGENVSQRFSMIDKEIPIREHIYEVTINAIHDFPVLGSGLGTFEDVFLMYRDAEFPKRFSKRITHAHNTYLETILELGIPAFLLMAFSIIAICVCCFNGVINRKKDAIFPAIALASSVLVWMHALFDFSIEMPAIAITYAVIMGIGCAQSWSSTDSLSDRLSNKNK